jgi:hypothetical protein
MMLIIMCDLKYFDLLRQAMETLAFRWDEARGVRHREFATGLLSINMMQCTMRIAREMTGLRVTRREVLEIIQRYLKLLRQSNVFPEQVLDDIRRFFRSDRNNTGWLLAICA